MDIVQKLFVVFTSTAENLSVIQACMSMQKPIKAS
jgi:hypothetical protein